MASKLHSLAIGLCALAVAASPVAAGTIGVIDNGDNTLSFAAVTLESGNLTVDRRLYTISAAAFGVSTPRINFGRGSGYFASSNEIALMFFDDYFDGRVVTVGLDDGAVDTIALTNVPGSRDFPFSMTVLDDVMFSPIDTTPDNGVTDEEVLVGYNRDGSIAFPVDDIGLLDNDWIVQQGGRLYTIDSNSRSAATDVALINDPGLVGGADGDATQTELFDLPGQFRTELPLLGTDPELGFIFADGLDLFAGGTDAGGIATGSFQHIGRFTEDGIDIELVGLLDVPDGAIPQIPAPPALALMMIGAAALVRRA